MMKKTFWEVITIDMTNFTAGFSRLDITPFLGIPMGGSWKARCMQGVLDPLQVNAIAFGDGEKTALLLVMDLVGIYRAHVPEMLQAVAEATNLPLEAVNIHCTHTHTGPSVASDEQYADFLKHRMCDAAVMAIADRKPVTDVRWAEVITENMTFPRRYKLSDGTVMTNPAGEWAKMIVDYASTNDETLRLVRILREDAPEIDLVNFASHPDNIHGEYISADFPGATRSTVEAAHPEAKCVFLQGCEGQMVIGTRLKPRTPSSYEKAMAHGVKLGEYVLEMFDKAVSTGQTGFHYGKKSTTVKTKWDPARVPEAQRIADAHAAGRDDLIHPVQKFANYMRVEANRILRLDKEKLAYQDAQLSAITFCGMAIAGFPGEMFNELGVQVRKNSKFPITLTLAICNGSLGYFPTAEAFEQGGYEAYNTPYDKGAAEQMANTLDELIESL